MRRRIKAHRKRDHPDERDAHQRDDDRNRKPRGDQRIDRALVDERIPQIALHDVFHPFDILDVHRLVEPVARLEGGDIVLVDLHAAGAQLVDVGGQIVSRRELNDHEHHHRQREQKRYDDEESLDDVLKHGSILPFRPCRRGARGNRGWVPPPENQMSLEVWITGDPRRSSSRRRGWCRRSRTPSPDRGSRRCGSSF